MLDIVAFARRAQRHAAGLDKSAFAADERTQDAVIRCLEVVGEAAGRLSEEAREKRPGVPWAAVIARGHGPPPRSRVR